MQTSSLILELISYFHEINNLITTFFQPAKNTHSVLYKFYFYHKACLHKMNNPIGQVCS